MTTVEWPRVLLVDDNEGILERAAEALSDACVIVGAVKDGRAALDAVGQLRPDVVVLDISMPGMSGFDVALRLRGAGSVARIVFLSVHDDEEFVRAALAAGGIGYVEKSRLASDVAIAVKEAFAGRHYVSQRR